MEISFFAFFDGLSVDSRYYLKQFKRIGVVNRFFLSDSDLRLIISSLPVTRYKSAMVVKRAFDVLAVHNV